MPIPNDDDELAPSGSDPTAAPGQPTGGGAPTGVPPTEPVAGPGDSVQVKHSDFKRIKQEQRDRGRREALDELDVRARASGFNSWGDAMSALVEMKKPQPLVPTARPQPQEPPKMTKPPKPTTPPPNEQALRGEAERAKSERVKTRKAWRASESKRRELEARLNAKEAEMSLRDECYRAGVADVDYVIRLLTRELEGKTQDEITKYDRNAFYSGLKSDKPYLFGEKVVPATTGVDPSAKPSLGAAPTAPTPGAAPATPPPGGANAADAAAKKFDARTAKPEEVQKRLRELGLNPHM